MKAFGVSVFIMKDGMIVGVARRNDPNDFGLPGGKTDTNETEEAAAIRECFEETGIRIWNLKEINRGLCGKDLAVTFSCDWEGDPSSQPGEPICRWITLDEAMAGCFGEYNAFLFKKLGLIP
jgi:8-oxo-dGTP pyrophosphatase MutT (NUDIX family)